MQVIKTKRTMSWKYYFKGLFVPALALFVFFRGHPYDTIKQSDTYEIAYFIMVTIMTLNGLFLPFVRLLIENIFFRFVNKEKFMEMWVIKTPNLMAIRLGVLWFIDLLFYAFGFIVGLPVAIIELVRYLKESKK